MLVFGHMKPLIKEAESVIAPLKRVTSLSKYLALALFIFLPFLGGYIGYTHSPAKVLETQDIIQVSDTSSAKEHNLFNLVNLCGREFKVNEVYIDGTNLVEKLDDLLRSPLQSSTQEETKSSCGEFLANVSDSTFIKLTVTKVNYGFSEIESLNKFDAYAVQFISNKEGYPIDVGFFINKESHDVNRIVVLDGSKGLKVGELE